MALLKVNLMPDDKIDLRRLPSWLQYLISLSVVALVVGAAWFVGRDEPIPRWISHFLIPGLGVLYIILVVAALAGGRRKK